VSGTAVNGAIVAVGILTIRRMRYGTVERYVIEEHLGSERYICST
jgi:hypothetical protein